MRMGVFKGGFGLLSRKQEDLIFQRTNCLSLWTTYCPHAQVDQPLEVQKSRERRMLEDNLGTRSTKTRRDRGEKNQRHREM